jgi:hypothetical protein
LKYTNALNSLIAAHLTAKQEGVALCSWSQVKELISQDFDLFTMHCVFVWKKVAFNLTCSLPLRVTVVISSIPLVQENLQHTWLQHPFFQCHACFSANFLVMIWMGSIHRTISCSWKFLKGWMSYQLLMDTKLIYKFAEETLATRFNDLRVTVYKFKLLEHLVSLPTHVHVTFFFLRFLITIFILYWNVAKILCSIFWSASPPPVCVAY